MKPPTTAEVRAYKQERGFGKYLNPVEFWNWYESVGWKRGKTKITRWKAAATGWAARNGWTEENAQRPAQKVSQADEDTLRRKNSTALEDLLKDGGKESQRLRGRINLILGERQADARRQGLKERQNGHCNKESRQTT